MRNNPEKTCTAATDSRWPSRPRPYQSGVEPPHSKGSASKGFADFTYLIQVKFIL